MESNFQFELPLCDISAHLTSTFVEGNHAKRTLTSKNYIRTILMAISVIITATDNDQLSH